MNTTKVLKVMMSVGVLSFSALAAGCVGAEADDGEQAEQGADALSNDPRCKDGKFLLVQDLKVATPDGAIAPGETATVTATIVYSTKAPDGFISYPSAALTGDCESKVEQEYSFSGFYGRNRGQSFEAKWQVTANETAPIGGKTTVTATGAVPTGDGGSSRCAGAPQVTLDIPIAAH